MSVVVARMEAVLVIGAASSGGSVLVGPLREALISLSSVARSVELLGLFVVPAVVLPAGRWGAWARHARLRRCPWA